MQVQNAATRFGGNLAPNPLLVCLSGSNNLNRHKAQPVKLTFSFSLLQDGGLSSLSSSSDPCCCNLFSLHPIRRSDNSAQFEGSLKPASMPCHDSVDDGPRGTLSRTSSMLGATVIKVAEESHGWDSPKKQISRSKTYVPCKV